MSKHNYSTQAAENQARVVGQDRHAAYLKTVSSTLKPLDMAREIGMRRTDIDVFVGAAVYFDHIIAVRHTNVNAHKYVGKKGYVPKPFDCKIKTAQVDAYAPSARIYTECGGLTVNPDMVGYAAFPDSKKLGKAMEEWTKFLNGKAASERVSGIFPRAGNGFYAVDKDKTSKHYGCLMLSEQNVPSANFRLDDVASHEFKRNHMRYVHSDYDLYGLIDVEKTVKKLKESNGLKKHSNVLIDGLLQGMRHSFTEQYEDFRLFINNGIGVDMIQHDAQANIEHIDDTLYVFYPDRSKYALHNASANAIRDIFDVVFRQEVNT